MRRRSSLLSLAFLTAVAVPAHAIPDVVSYAARVENSTGPFDGTAAVRFSLHAAPTGGESLWTEEVASAVVIDGDLVHDLGSVTPLDAAILDEEALFLEVTFNGETLTPRVPVNAAPYALRSREAELAEVAVDAEQLGGRPASAYAFVAGENGGLTLTDTAFSIAPGGVTAAHLATGAVGAAAIADGSVGAAELGTGAVVAAKLAAGAVGADALQAGAVTTAKLAAAAVTSAQLADGAVVSARVAPGAIGEAALATNAVTSLKIATDAVTASKLAGGTAQLAARPAGCGGGVQTLNQRVTSGSRPAGCSGGLLFIDGSGAACSPNIPCFCPTCTTLMCGINSGGNPRFMACDGTCGVAVTATTCSADAFPDTNIGFAVFAP